MDYQISEFTLGSNKNSQVYKLTSSNELLIAKIYDDSKKEKYEKEKEILTEIKTNIPNNEVFIKLKDIVYYQGMFEYPLRDTIYHNCLFFDFLPKFSLLDYISQNVNQIYEIYAKYIAYKLLIAIETLKQNNISHNKLDIGKIMFDEKFNLKLIHFSDANWIKDKNEKYIDLFGLGQILIKLLSLGRCKAISYDKKSKLFYILINFEMSIRSQKKYLKLSEFWKSLETTNINISQKFISFFFQLISTRITNQDPNIKQFINNEWLTEVISDIEYYETEFKNYFNNLYKRIIEDSEIDNKIEIDIKDIIKINSKEMEEAKSLSENILNYKNEKNIFGNKDSDYLGYDYLKNENFGNIRYKKNKNVLSKEPDYYSRPIFSYKIEDENYYIPKKELNINKKNNYDENSSSEEEEEEEKENKADKKNKNFKKSYTYNIDKNEESNNFYGYNIDNTKRSLNIKKKINDSQEYKIPKKKLEKKAKKSLKFSTKEKTKIVNQNVYEKSIKNEINYYEKPKPQIKLRSKKINKINNTPNKLEINFGIRKENFNYLHLIIKNNEKKDAKEALINFLEIYKNKIKENYMSTDMFIEFKDEKNTSFIIKFEIELQDYCLNDDLIFFDKDDENKYLNGNKFEIKVELKEYKNNQFSNINEYLLVFDNILGDEEDFYEHLKIIKNIAKSLLLIHN